MCVFIWCGWFWGYNQRGMGFVLMCDDGYTNVSGLLKLLSAQCMYNFVHCMGLFRILKNTTVRQKKNIFHSCELNPNRMSADGKSGTKKTFSQNYCCHLN